MGELAGLPGPVPVVHSMHQGCRITKYLATLDDEDRAIVERHLADHEVISDRALSTWFMQTVGVTISGSVVRAHRTGDCCGGAGRVRGRGVAQSRG